MPWSVTRLRRFDPFLDASGEEREARLEPRGLPESTSRDRLVVRDAPSALLTMRLLEPSSRDRRQNAASSISISEALPDLIAAKSPAVSGRIRSKKKRAVASFAL